MVRPAMVYGLETVAITKKQVEEMKILRFAMGVTRKDKIRNEYIRGTVKVEQLGIKMREVWTCPEERPRVSWKKGDENEVTGKEEKSEAKGKIFRSSEGRYGESWCEGEGH